MTNIAELFAKCTTSTNGKINACQIGIPKVNDANGVFHSLLNTVYMWAGIVCIIVLVIAGYIYVTSAANAANIKRAKDAIIGAVVGLLIIMMAFTITQFVLGRF